MFNLFLKGFLIGIGKIIPGVSGSMLAISFGVYEKVLEIISNFFKNIKENIAFMLPLCLGFILAVFSSSNLLYYLINKYYIIMMFLFLGLIIGGIPNLKKEFKFNIKNIIIFIISFSVIILLSFIKSNNNTNYYNFSFFFIGILEAFTTIVPGISGTAIMMLVGCYSSVLEMFSNVFMVSNLPKLIPFLIGVIIGAILLSKIITVLLKKYKKEVFSSIFGFMLASIILLMIQILPNINNYIEVIIGLILMTISIKLSSLL